MALAVVYMAGLLADGLLGKLKQSADPSAKRRLLHRMACLQRRGAKLFALSSPHTAPCESFLPCGVRCASVQDRSPLCCGLCLHVLLIVWLGTHSYATLALLASYSHMDISQHGGLWLVSFWFPFAPFWGAPFENPPHDLCKLAFFISRRSIVLVNHTAKLRICYLDGCRSGSGLILDPQSLEFFLYCFSLQRG